MLLSMAIGISSCGRHFKFINTHSYSKAPFFIFSRHFDFCCQVEYLGSADVPGITAEGRVEYVTLGKQTRIFILIFIIKIYSHTKI